jgi:hypothetical protein
MDKFEKTGHVLLDLFRKVLGVPPRRVGVETHLLKKLKARKDFEEVLAKNAILSKSVYILEKSVNARFYNQSDSSMENLDNAVAEVVETALFALTKIAIQSDILINGETSLVDQGVKITDGILKVNKELFSKVKTLLGIIEAKDKRYESLVEKYEALLNKSESL